MIHFTKNTSSGIVVTLTERQTLTTPNYLFWFKSRGTNQIVAFVMLNATDTSPHKERYNQFSIDVDIHFADSPEGDWEYEIYEQTSTTNTNPDNALTLLETGIMRLSNLGNLLEVNVYSNEFDAEPVNALLISDEDYSGYLNNEPDNTVVVPVYQPTNYTTNNPDNSFITL